MVIYLKASSQYDGEFISIVVSNMPRVIENIFCKQNVNNLGAIPKTRRCGMTERNDRGTERNNGGTTEHPSNTWNQSPKRQWDVMINIPPTPKRAIPNIQQALNHPPTQPTPSPHHPTPPLHTPRSKDSHNSQLDNLEEKRNYN